MQKKYTSFNTATRLLTKNLIFRLFILKQKKLKINSPELGKKNSNDINFLECI